MVPHTPCRTAAKARLAIVPADAKRAQTAAPPVSNCPARITSAANASAIPTNCARWLATQRRSSAYAANAWTALLGSAGIGCNQVPARSSMVPAMAQTAPILFSRTRTLSSVKRRRRPYPARAVSCASTLFTAGRSDMRLRWSCTLEKRDDSTSSASIHRARVKR
jgi:hypothetical protein